MKRFLLFIFAFVAVAIASLPAEAQEQMQRIKLTDYGARPDSKEDACEAFHKAVQACGGRNAIIEFPKGRYDFWQNPNEDATTAMTLRNAHNITIEGNGSEFVFHGKMRIFLIDRSHKITLRNFTTDWERTYISQGEFAKITDSYVDLKIDPTRYPFKVENERITFIGEGWTAGVHDSYLNIHEKATGEIAYRTRDNHTGNIFKGKAEQIAPDVVRFYGRITPQDMPVKAGQIITLYHGTYIMTGIEIGNSKDIELEDITLYHALSTGVYGYRSENITMRRVSTQARASKHRVFSTVADASHFTCCRGEILVEECAHTGQGDDFINVRGVYSRINAIEDNNAVKVQRGWFLEPGDTVWSVDYTTVSRREELIIKSKRYIPESDEWLIAFTTPVTGSIKEGNFLENKSWTPSLTIRNCRFEKRNRARGMLVTTPRRVIVENNYFNTAGTAILIEGDLDYWYESGAHSSLTIRNNVFENCSTSGCETGNRWEWGEAPITISPSYRPSSADSPVYHRGITIEGNTFLCFDAPVVAARSVGGLRFVGNTLKRTTDYEPFLWQKSNISLDGCRDVVVGKNKVSDDFPAKLIEIKHMRPSDLTLKGRNRRTFRVNIEE